MSGKYNSARQAWLTGSTLNWTSGLSVGLLLLGDGYTFSASHTTTNDIPLAQRISDYGASGLPVPSASNGQASFTVSTHTFLAVGGGVTPPVIGGIAIYNRVNGDHTTTSNPLIVFLNNTGNTSFNFTTSGNNVSVNWVFPLFSL